MSGFELRSVVIVDNPSRIFCSYLGRKKRKIAINQLFLLKVYTNCISTESSLKDLCNGATVLAIFQIYGLLQFFKVGSLGSISTYGMYQTLFSLDLPTFGIIFLPLHTGGYQDDFFDGEMTYLSVLFD